MICKVNACNCHTLNGDVIRGVGQSFEAVKIRNVSLSFPSLQQFSPQHRCVIILLSQPSHPYPQPCTIHTAILPTINTAKMTKARFIKAMERKSDRLAQLEKKGKEKVVKPAKAKSERPAT